MAIVQVSRITQRKGLEVDLPQPLAGAELGWATDQRRLFIGNGTLDEGAPVVGNTEILTEFSDLLAYTTAYTYQGEAAGYTVQTGPTAGVPVSQSIQSRLDSYAIVTEFGAQGDGVTDDTEAINRAFNQLYCIQTNPQVRRSLFFPAGTYIISNTLLIPAYAKLYGEGADHTIILFQVQNWAANTAYAEGVLVKFEDPATAVISFYRAVASVPATGIALTNTAYWDSQSLPNYVCQTADSQQQTGANIGVNSAVSPRNIEVSGMTFQTLEFGNDSSIGHNVALIEKAQQCYFDSVNFIGPLTTVQLDTSIENLTGVEFSSSPASVCSQITFDKCRFSGLTFAINTDQQVEGITVSNGWFDTLYQGIVLGDNAPVDGGPTGFRIMHNLFDNIYNEGIVIDNCQLNASGYNTFYDVGNRFNGTNSPKSPIISINADNNISVGDMFARTTAQTQLDLGWPRIQLFNPTTGIPVSIGVTGSDQIQMGNYVRTSGQQQDILDGDTETIFSVNTALSVQAGGFQAFKMEYTIIRLTASTQAVRTGVLTVVSGAPGDSSGEGLVYTDDYTENEHTDVTLQVLENNLGLVEVKYASAATTYTGTIYYSVTHLA